MAREKGIRRRAAGDEMGKEDRAELEPMLTVMEHYVQSLQESCNYG